MQIPRGLQKSVEESEAHIQDKLIAFLRARDWVVMQTHGNLYQCGFPDLYALHHIYNARWIEVKKPHKFSFTPAQRKYFPLMHSSGVGIWVLQGYTEDQYQRLFRPPNWASFMYP